jgi:allantoin racemase
VRIGYLRPASGFSSAEESRREAIIRGLVPAEVEVHTLVNPLSPRHADSEHAFADMVAIAKPFLSRLDPRDYDILVLAGALDPGLPELREASPIPIIGPGESSLYVASIFGAPLSIVTVDEHAVAATGPLLEQTPAKPRIASIRSMDTPVRFMLNDHATGVDALFRECRLAVKDDGAKALFLGSMTLGTFGVASRLHEELGVPILDPLRISMGVAVQCLFSSSPPPGSDA